MNGITSQHVKLEETLYNYEKNLACSTPDFTTLRALLKQCRELKSLRNGKRVHLQLRRIGIDRETLPGNLLVQMYGECGSLEDAKSSFEQIARPDVYSWNILLAAYAQNGDLASAKSVFQKMPRKNVVSWNGMVKAFAQAGHLDEARECFEQMPRKNVVAWTGIVTAYAQHGHVSEAGSLFSRMPERDTVAWNAMLSAYAQNGCHKEVLGGFAAMDQQGEACPNEITFLSVVQACDTPHMGKTIHLCAIESGFHRSVKVSNALISLYGRTSCITSAEEVFGGMEEKDLVSWTAMLTAYARRGDFGKAMSCFRGLLFEGFQPNQVTFLSALSACEGLGKLESGETIHRYFEEGRLELNVVVGTALVNMYGKCHSVEKAESVFSRIPDRNIQSWTAMLAAYADNGDLREALRFFKLMDLDGETPNRVTSSIILDACSSHVAVEDGKLIHSSLLHTGFAFDVMVATALLDLYAKSGHVDDAVVTFMTMPCKNVLSWTSMVEAFARSGYSKHALEAFHEMALEGVQPDEVSLISFLSGCSHGGLLADAVSYFVCLTSDFNVPVLVDHYLCITDLLGRLGKLDQALNVVTGMPFRPESGAWMTLLGAFQIHSDYERARGLRST